MVNVQFSEGTERLFCVENYVINDLEQKEQESASPV